MELLDVEFISKKMYALNASRIITLKEISVFLSTKLIELPTVFTISIKVHVNNAILNFTLTTEFALRHLLKIVLSLILPLRVSHVHQVTVTRLKTLLLIV